MSHASVSISASLVPFRAFSISQCRQTWPLIEVECMLLCSTLFSLTVTKWQNCTTYSCKQKRDTSSSYIAPVMFPNTKLVVCSEHLKLRKCLLSVFGVVGIYYIRPEENYRIDCIPVTHWSAACYIFFVSCYRLLFFIETVVFFLWVFMNSWEC